MRVALIRHLTPVAPPGICYGRLDVPAAESTPAILSALRKRVAGLRSPRLLSSPARRCLTLAKPLGAALGIVPVVDDRLLELDFGTWEGIRWDDVDRAALDLWAADPGGFVPPGGEPVAALIARVAAFVRDLRACGSDAIVVSHGGPLRLLAPVLRGEVANPLAPAPAFGAVSVVACQPHRADATVRTAHSAVCSAAPSTSPV